MIFAIPRRAYPYYVSRLSNPTSSAPHQRNTALPGDYQEDSNSEQHSGAAATSRWGFSSNSWTNPSAGRKRWFRDTAFWIHAGLQLLIILISLGTSTGDLKYPEFTWYSSPLIIILALALLIQRYCLEPMLFIIIPCLVGLTFTSFTFTPITYGAVMRVIFVLAAYHQHPKRWIGFAVVSSSLAISYNILLQSETEYRAQEFIIYFTMLLLSTGFFSLLGSMRREDIQRSRLLQERAALLEEQAKLAAVAERTRIAREMHDIVAHSLTGIIAQADGGRFAGKKDPAVALNALDTIADNGRKALQEMRDLLSVLRTDEVRSFNTAGLEDVPQLIQDASIMGLRVQYKVQGKPVELSPLAGSVVFRIVQEALTNAAKHAGKVQVSVCFEWSTTALDIRITNPLGKQDPAIIGAGQGLIGMQERIHAVRGEFAASKQGDIFVVTARIPVVHDD